MLTLCVWAGLPGCLEDADRERLAAARPSEIPEGVPLPQPPPTDARPPGDAEVDRPDVLPCLEPTEEICNGLDDDCDSLVDEGIGGACQIVGNGCEQVGQERCLFENGEAGITCSASPLEGLTEACNGLDDDCDGTADEGFTERLGLACANGPGICAGSGALVCREGAPLQRSPSEVEQGIAEGSLYARGFEPCWRSTYAEAGRPVAEMLEQCEAERLAVACKRVDDDVVRVVASGVRRVVLRANADRVNPINVHNGANWYFGETVAWGFGPFGTPVELRGCDVSTANAGRRLCWPLQAGQFQPGGRCGALTDLESAEFERVVYRFTGALICDGQPEPERAREEACNGVDDDCDGSVDERLSGCEP